MMRPADCYQVFWRRHFRRGVAKACHRRARADTDGRDTDCEEVPELWQRRLCISGPEKGRRDGRCGRGDGDEVPLQDVRARVEGEGAGWRRGEAVTESHVAGIAAAVVVFIAQEAAWDGLLSQP